MFHVGDKIVYPMYGGGVIESIEDRKVFGEILKYYIIKMVLGEIKVMVPVDRAESMGIRRIEDEGGYDKVVKILSGNSKSMDKKWNIRFRENEEKLKKGYICDIAEIVNYLHCMNVKGKLSTGEKNMLEQSKQILISEMALIKDESYEEMEKKINKILNICEL